MLGEQIKKLRLSKSINQVQLANQLNVSKQSVSNWENNNILPSIEMLIKIACFFHCSTDYLLELEDSEKISIEITNLTSSQAVHIRMLIADLEEANKKAMDKQ